MIENCDRLYRKSLERAPLGQSVTQLIWIILEPLQLTTAEKYSIHQVSINDYFTFDCEYNNNTNYNVFDVRFFLVVNNNHFYVRVSTYRFGVKT